MTMKNIILCTLLTFSAATLSLAEMQTFDFKDPKGVNNVIFKLDAPLESINGTGVGIAGKVQYDPDNPEKISGTITLATESLHVPNPTMKDHLLGENWLNAETFPQITFEALSASNVKKTGDTVTADLTGRLTVKGVTKEKTVPVRITYLPGKLEARSRVPGDLLVLRSEFSISRKECNSQPGQNEDKVSDEIELSLSIAGADPS